MEKSVEAVKYMISVWDEVTGKTWREKPDHVQKIFLEAEAELHNLIDEDANRCKRCNCYGCICDVVDDI